MRARATIILLLLVLAAGAGADAWISKREIFQVSFVSSIAPIPTNTIHSWVLTVSNSDGDAVLDAEITVEGGMPEHDHGLPTRPRVTVELGDGSYRLEGLRFHMAGNWEVSVTISADGKTDTVIIPLQL